MTAQITDTVTIEDHTYELIGVRGDGLFEAQTHGFRPQAVCTACWRGYQCAYAVASRKLILRTLRLNLTGGKQPQTPPELFHGVPRVDLRSNTGRITLSGMFDSTYDGLDLPMPYTGGLLLADEFISELYVHIGFHPAWKFRRVHELNFSSGTMTGARDISDRLAAVRDRLIGQPLQPAREASAAEKARWIDDCFSLDYPALE